MTNLIAASKRMTWEPDDIEFDDGGPGSEEGGTPIAPTAPTISRQIGLTFDPAEPRDAHGRWSSAGGVLEKIVEPIGMEGARGNSRPVSHAEFQRLAAQGQARLRAIQHGPGGTAGLDKSWPQIKTRAFAEVQKSWGGATVDPRSGHDLPQGADKYAMSVKPAGMDTTSIPEHASLPEFSQAMDIARSKYGRELAKGGSYLGIFHDDDTHRIDIDPVTVVDSLHDVETIGAYTHAIGGAYHFASGDGFWPPHVEEGASLAAPGRYHWAGPGQWHSYADAEQAGLPEQQQAELDSINGQIGLAFHPDELRDRRGRWTRGGGATVARENFGPLPPAPAPDPESPNAYLFDQASREAHLADINGYSDVTEQLNWAVRALEGGREGDLVLASRYIGKAAYLAAMHGDDLTAKRLGDLRHLSLMAKPDTAVAGTPRAAATELVTRAAPVVPKLLGGGHEAWNGQVRLFSRPESPYVQGEMSWAGQMNLRQDIAEKIRDDAAHPDQPISDPMPYQVVLHELIHGVLPQNETYPQQMRAYQNETTAQIEEGFTELGAIHHAPEFFDKVGVGSRTTPFLKPGGTEDPAHVAARDQLVAAMRDEVGKLIADGRPPHAQAAARLSDAAMGVQTGIGKNSDTLIAIREVAQLGDPAAAAAGKRLQDQLMQVMHTPEHGHSTLSEYARQLQDPQRIANGDAYGHYGWQTKAAQEWVQQIAGDEGVFGYQPGQPGWKRMVQLADEINRQGTSGKVKTMARQVVFTALRGGPNASLLDDPKALADVIGSAEQRLLRSWRGDEAAVSAHQAGADAARIKATSVAMARAAERLAAERAA